MALRKHYVRVHESTGEFGAEGAAFNLDNFNQFERYAKSVEASNAKTHYRVPDTFTNKLGEGKVHIVTLLAKDRSQGHHTISISAQREERHIRKGCVFCERRFNGAGNGSTRREGSL